MKRYLPLLALVLSLNALAQDQQWVPITNTDTMTYEGLSGSFVFDTTRVSREPVGVITVRQTDRSTRRVTFEKNYVMLKDCRAGMGTITTTRLDGTYYYHVEFVLNGGSIASSLADIICGLADRNNARGL